MSNLPTQTWQPPAVEHATSGGVSPKERPNATDDLWRAFQDATEDVKRTTAALAAAEAELPDELRGDAVLRQLCAGAPIAAMKERRGPKVAAAEKAMGAAIDRQSAFEHELIGCEARSAIDVERKLATLHLHIDAHESDWSMKVIRRAQADLGRLAGMPVAPVSDTDDPAVAAFERWRKAREAELDFYRRSPDLVGDDCPEFLALEQAAMEAERALANTVATTPAGLAGQIRFAFRIFGELKPDRLGIEPDDYEVPDGLEGGGGAELLRSMLAGAERMTGRGS